MSKKKALGRGLSALLSDSSTDDRLEVDALPHGGVSLWFPCFSEWND